MIYAHQLVPGVYFYNPEHHVYYKVLHLNNTDISGMYIHSSDGIERFMLISYVVMHSKIRSKAKRWRIASKVEGLFGVGE